MAQMISNFPIIGRIGELSSYRMRGSDKIIVRMKGGADKKKIKNAPEFANTRRINSEFGGRSASSSTIMRAIFPLKALADYNIAGPLNALIKPIQVMDTESDWGQRNVYITRNPKLLEGFSLNKKNGFDTIVRNPISFTLSREERSATVNFPAMMPGINFFVPPPAKSFYSFVAVLGVVPDFKFDKDGYKAVDKIENTSDDSMSEWYSVLRGSAAVDLTVRIPQKHFTPESENFTLLLSIGIRFGVPGINEDIKQVKYAGAGKILVAG
jgi:hypothetical protein